MGLKGRTPSIAADVKLAGAASAAPVATQVAQADKTSDSGIRNRTVQTPTAGRCWECATCTLQNSNPLGLCCELCGAVRHTAESVGVLDLATADDN